ncbi:SRPBCC family protein [Sphingomonas jeddahensis]|uniref:Polyketide cyclase / dehydrase and lipid transport n=1 Tax=Sphingomonas jeddahensis TaxID=1915074 RepID=A0A1V2ESP3_9SPHN|nr:polyketide cyclase [Sphingomonas jeddahensis]ONF95610.1 Polyketide cyclase / dehydrase and lipid transport [Sphingomonas jeddahensis]
MLPAIVLSVTINRPWRDVYEAFWRPTDFQRWASGLSEYALRQDGDSWVGKGADGDIRVFFTSHNDLGVMDHRVHPEGADEVHVPLRVIANGNGAEVQLTLFRQPDMDDEAFARDRRWIRSDLAKLKALAER